MTQQKPEIFICQLAKPILLWLSAVTLRCRVVSGGVWRIPARTHASWLYDPQQRYLATPCLRFLIYKSEMLMMVLRLEE